MTLMTRIKTLVLRGIKDVNPKNLENLMRWYGERGVNLFPNLRQLVCSELVPPLTLRMLSLFTLSANISTIFIGF